MAKGGFKVYLCFIVCCLAFIRVNGAKTTDTLKISTCKNEKIDLRPGAGLKYQWQDGSSSNYQTIVADVNKTVKVVVYTSKDTATIIYNITPINCIINAGPDVAICKGASTSLKATTNGTFKEWKPVTALSSPSTISTTAKPTITTKYVVSAIFPKQNLITNGDFEKGFENFSSDYVYGVNTLSYGYYVIGTNPYSYGPSWFRNFTDHTSGTGKMMIVDGSEVLNQDVYRTTVSVLAGENYVFSTWLKNVKGDLVNPAKLRFYVNGQAMGSINLPEGETEWVYYSTFWTAPTDTTITISIKNQNTSGIGNDFAIDDMTFADFITISDTVEVVVNNLPLVTATTNKPKICNGESVTISGGNASTYIWNNGVIDNMPFSPTATKTYLVTGIDVNGCKNTAGVAVTVNPLPTITALAKPSVICVGASSILTASGASNYIWSNGQANGVTVYPLSTDIYSVTGTDVNGCINKTSVSIIVNPLPTVSALSSVVCNGQSAKLIGVGASTYVWDNSISNNTSFIPTTTKTYTVTGTDLKSCKGTASAIVTVNSLPNVSAIAGPSTICVGKTTKLSGQGAQSYSWDNSVSDNVSFSPLTTKTYKVTGIDNNGCINTSSIVVTVNALPTITVVSPTICIGQSTKLSANGAIGYEWDSGITDNVPFSPVSTTQYSVTGADGKGCINTSSAFVIVNPVPTISAVSPTICSGKSTKLIGVGANSYVWDGGIVDNVLFTPTLSKTYTVTGTDSKGCKGTASAIITVNSLPNVSTIADPAVICVGKTTKLSGSGQGAQTYIWDNSVSDNIPFSPISTKTYKVTGIDNNGCINTSSVTVTVNALPTITVSSPTICIGQSTKLSANGASTYVWDGGITDNVPFSPVSTTQYSVTGYDEKGCFNTSTAIVLVNLVPTITAISSTICYGKSTKLIGVGANSYVWDGGIVDNVLFIPTLSKTYTVTGTDSKGCKGTASAIITVNSLPNVSAIADPAVICVGKTTKLSGQGAQTYIWDNSVSDNIPFSPISTKTYKVTGSDNNSCINTSSIVVTVNALPTITVVSPTICIGQSTKLSAKGASSYEWDGDITDNVSFLPIETETYSVTGTDVNYCVNTSIALVTVNPLPTISVNSQTICLGISTMLKGSGALSYVWDGGITDNVLFTPTQTKNYFVTGTDSKGCKNIGSTTIIVNPVPTVTALSQSICKGQQYVKLQGVGAISYEWDGDIYDNMQFAPQHTKTYTVTGTDAKGCKNTATAIVTVYPVPTVTSISQQVCPNQKVKLQGQGADSYIWDGGIVDNVEFTAPQLTTVYHVTGTDSKACYGIASATISINKIPALQFAAISPICIYADTISINKASPSGGIYSGDGVIDTLFSPTVAGVGSHVISYSFTDNNGCKNTVSQTVQVNPKPLLAFSLDAQRCYDAGPLQLKASPVGGTFYGSGVVGSFFDPMLPDSELSIPISYAYTNPSTNCADTITRDIIVHYTPPPLVYDVQTTTYDLQTSIPAEGDGQIQWYDNSSLGKKLFIGNPYFHGYSNVVERFYYITQIINGCESVADTMRLKITSCVTPSPIVNKPTKKCMYNTLELAIVSNTIIAGKTANVIWRDKNYAIVSNSASFTPVFVGPGSVTYMVSLELNGCEGAGVNVTWTRYKTPSPVIKPLNSICEGSFVPIFEASNVYGDVKWYNNASLDSLIAISTTLKPLKSNPGAQYYWATNNDMCVSEPVKTQFEIYQKPAAPFGEVLYESCQGAPIVSMSVIPAKGTTWYNSKNSKIAVDIISYQPPLSSLILDQKVTYSTIYFDGYCYSDPFLFNYLLKQKPAIPKLHPDTICLGSSNLSLSVAKGNKLIWYFPSIEKKYEGFNVTPEIVEIGTFAFHVWDELNGCKSDIATDSVTTGPTPKNGVIGPQQICVNTTKQRYRVTTKNQESEYIWKVTGGRVSYIVTDGAQLYQDFDFIEQGIDTIYVTEKNKFGCIATDSAVIRIASNPSPDFSYTVPYENYKYHFTNITDSLYITDGKYKELLPQSFVWNFGRETDTLVPQSWEEDLQEKVYDKNYPFGTYDIFLISNPIGYDCPDTITKQIYVDIKETLYVPNAFCPDHKSPNLSHFTAKGFNLKYYKMWIYDIWGNLLWYTDKLFNGQPADGWDGTYDGVVQKVDCYVWKMEVEFLDGKLWDGQKGVKTEGKTSFGNVLLLR